MSAWRPIETAPRDGTRILGFWSYLYEGDDDVTCDMAVIAWDEYPDPIGSGWNDGGGLATEGVYTHWHPLPEPPTKEGETQP